MEKKYVRGEYFRTLDYYVSPENFNDEMLKDFNISPELEIHDVTLRDGEQMTGVAFTKDDKIVIAKMLEEAGIHRIEAGMPAVSKDDESAIRQIVKNNKNSKIFAFSRATENDVKLAADCGVDGVVIEIPVNAELIKFGYQWDDSKAFNSIVRATNLAHELGLHADLFLMDSSRMRVNTLIEKIKSIQKEGWVDSATLVDTQGVLATSTARFMVKKLVEGLNIPVEGHFHNDIGMATANTLAALEQGASVLHTTMLGIGPRAGQAATEQIVMAMKLLYGIDSGYGVDAGINLPKLYELAKVVGERAPFNFPVNQPVVGKDLYTLEDGMPATWWTRIWKDHPLALYGILPSNTGRPPIDIALGKNSGTASIRYWVDKMNLTLKSEDDIPEILYEVKSKGQNEKRVLTEDEFMDIVSKYILIRDLI